jgi:protocatechuate 3,4-dioxygenase beta subunit
VRAAPGGDERRRVVATAGADGAFRFEGLAPGSWSVALGGGGFGTRLDENATEAVVVVVAGGVAEVEIRGQELAVVAGRVVGPDGQPVAKVKVEVLAPAFLSRERGLLRLVAATGEDGSYEVRDVTPGGNVQVEASAEGLALAQRHLPDLAPGSRTVVDLVLERAVSLDLLLVADDDGTPVPKALVWISDAKGGLYHGGEGGAFLPDAKGRIHATGLRPSPVKVQIDAEGFVTVPGSVIDPVERKDVVEIRLVRGFTISGRLLQADGTPVAGQWIRAHPEGKETEMRDLFLAPSDHTGKDGSFRLREMPAGRYRVGMYENSMTATVETVVEAGATGVILRLPAGRGPRSILIRIVDPEGKPVPLVMVRKVKAQGGSLRGRSQSTQHQKGEFTADIEEGLSTFFDVWDPRDADRGRLPLGHVLFAVPDDARGEMTVKLPPEGTVEGRVVDGVGRPVGGARIEVRTVPGAGLPEGLGNALIGTTVLERGEFAVHGIGAEEVELTATADGLVGSTARVAPGNRDVVLTLVAEANCELQVLDDAGSPLAGATVEVLLDVTPVGRTRRPGMRPSPRPTTDAQGKIRIKGLAPNRSYYLSISPPPGRTELVALNRKGWIPESGELRLERACFLEGTIRIDGKPPSDAWEGGIEAWRDGNWAGNARMESDGRFRIESLAAGKYELRVFGGSGSQLPGAWTAETGGAPAVLNLAGE